MCFGGLFARPLLLFACLICLIGCYILGVFDDLLTCVRSVFFAGLLIDLFVCRYICLFLRFVFVNPSLSALSCVR